MKPRVLLLMAACEPVLMVEGVVGSLLLFLSMVQHCNCKSEV
jgi:hypothetical protein